MKMIYHSKNNRGRNRNIILITTGVIVITLLIMTGLLSRTFYKTMMVLTRKSEQINPAITTFGSLFSSKIALEKENNDLKRSLAEAEIKISDREILLKENADLKAAVHFKADTRNINATVLSKPPFAPFDVMVVSAGETEGVKVGDKVMIGQTYIGNITLVSSNSSQLTLLSSPSVTNDAFIGDASLPVILNGKGGGNFETSLPQGANVFEGDLVYMYYLQTPLLIGKVSKIIDNEDKTLITILLTIPFNLYSISHVEIISS